MANGIIDLRENLEKMIRILEELEIPYFLSGGTLLGAIREKNFLQGDKDIDVSIMEEDIISKEDAFIRKLYEVFPHVEVRRRKGRLFQVIGGVTPREPIDYMIYFKAGNFRCHYWQHINAHSTYHADLFKPYKEIDFLGLKVSVPNEPEKFLEATFGKDWRTPIKGFTEYDGPNIVKSKDTGALAEAIEKYWERNKIRITWCCMQYYEDWVTIRALAQVYPYVDEIVIGDGSDGADMLRDFCKGLKKIKIIRPRPFERQVHPDFDTAGWRNYISAFATGEWLLWQDADELFTTFILKNMRKWIKMFRVEAIALHRVAHASRKRQKEVSREHKVRLWKNLSHIKWQGIAHDTVKGFRSIQLIAEDYYHDVDWLPSYPHRVIQLKDREIQGVLLDRTKKGYIKDWHKYSYKKREEILKSRE